MQTMNQDIQRVAGLDFGALWCAVMHDSTMWPIHGHYVCRTCGRRHPVPWAPENLRWTTLQVLVPRSVER
jgi:hypothetical protein